MKVYAMKVPSGFGLLFYKHKGLYYIKVLGTTILVYGRTVDEAFNELIKVLKDINDGIKNNEIDPATLIQKPSLSELILYLFGRVRTIIAKTRISSKYLQEVDSDLRMIHA